MKFYVAEIEILDQFCSCDLDLDPMTFIYELDRYPLDIYRKYENELPVSRLSKVIVLQTYTQTDRETHRHMPPKLNINCMSRRFLGGQ